MVIIMAIVTFRNYTRKQSVGSMAAVIRYTIQEKKTVWDGKQLVTGIGCEVQSAVGDFITAKQLHHKTGGKQFFHLVQSHPAEADVDPVVAHAAALKLAEYFDGCAILVSTHIDRDHIHSHLIINSVNTDTGKKLHVSQDEWPAIRKFNDAICKEFGLPVFQPDPKRKNSKSMTIGEYHSAARGDLKKMQLMAAIRDCMKYAANREQFIALMESEGYKVRWDKHQHILYESVTGWKCRDRLLFADRYLKEAMEREFQIRTEILHGRAHGYESATAYDTSRTGATVDNDTGGVAGTAAHRDPVRDAGDDGTAQQQAPFSGGAERMADGVSPKDLHTAGCVSDAEAGGRTTADGETSGGDDSTGWEKEREAFFSAQAQTTQTASSGMGWPDGGHGGDGIGYGAVASGLVQVGRRLEQAQHTAPVSDSTTQHHHTDNKTLQKEKRKKIALGQKEDDHEDEQTWQQTM